MTAPLRITLSEIERQMLADLRIAPGVVQRTKDRAHMLLLCGKGWKHHQVADCFDCHPNTVRLTIKRWQEKGIDGLWDQSGRGVKSKCSESDLLYLEARINAAERTYTIRQLVQMLEEERQVKLSTDRLGRILRTRAIARSQSSSC